MCVCVFWCPTWCPDHLDTICHEQAGERSQSAVISSYRNVRNSVCGVAVGRTQDQRALDTHIYTHVQKHMETNRTCEDI